MPIDLSKIPERLTNAATTGTLVPFIGAGISRSAKTADKNAFPTWKKLLEELSLKALVLKCITADEREQIDKLVAEGKYLMAAQALRSVLPLDVMVNLLESRFTPPDAEPGPIHHAIFKLRSPLIITTNYDLLLEDAYAKQYGKTAQHLTYREAPKIQALLQGHRLWHDRPSIFKIHGSVAMPSDAILSEMDYRNLLYREPGYRLVLSAIFVTKVVLMLGFSFDDPEIRLLMESLRESLKYGSQPDYIVIERDKKGQVELRRWREDFGLEAIEYDPSPGHGEVLKLVEHLASFVPVPSPSAGKPSKVPTRRARRKP